MMNKPAVLPLLLALLALLSGCINAGVTTTSPLPTTAPPVVINITPTQANELIKANSGNTNFAILDVRTPAEYAGGHLANALIIDYNAGNFKEEAGLLDKNKTYLVYCRTANRSASAVKIMEELGFKDIYHMTGGITEWQAAGYPTVK